MKLIQFYLPLNDNDGKKFHWEVFAEIKKSLTEKFKGVTAFSQSPADGLWDNGEKVQKDQVVLYEIMTENFEKEWWKNFIGNLEKKLKQEKILLRCLDISVL